MMTTKTNKLHAHFWWIWICLDIRLSAINPQSPRVEPTKKKSNLFAFRLSNERQGVERSSLFADVLATISPPLSRKSIAFTIDRLPLKRLQTSEGCGYKCGRSRKDQCLPKKKTYHFRCNWIWVCGIAQNDRSRSASMCRFSTTWFIRCWTGSKDRYRIADHLSLAFCFAFTFVFFECILIVFLLVGWPHENEINQNTLAFDERSHTLCPLPNWLASFEYVLGRAMPEERNIFGEIAKSFKLRPKKKSNRRKIRNRYS